MANGSSKCRPGFTFNFGGPASADADAADAEEVLADAGCCAFGIAVAAVKSNDGIAMRLENLAALSESRALLGVVVLLLLLPGCDLFVGLPTRSGCSRLLSDLHVTRGFMFCN